MHHTIFMRKNIFKLIYRFIVIAMIIAACSLKTTHENGEQIWFFTIQTNIFVAILNFFLIVDQILIFCHKKPIFEPTAIFAKLRILVTFFITITCLIYCFVLAPAGMIYNKTPFFTMFDVRNIILHIAVPILAIVDYILFGTKGYISYKQTWVFLIYPIIYFVAVNLRVLFGGKLFVCNNSYYPYFFLDPHLENQGWAMVAIYVSVIIVLFYGLASLYIYIDKKLQQKQIKNNLKQQKKPE